MKNLQHYLSLQYTVVVEKIAEEDGGGYKAYIPILGKYAVVGDGNSIPKAIMDLNKSKKDHFEYCIKNNVAIPEPE